jgi:hypothetical protein
LAKLATKNIKNFRKSELHIETPRQTDKGDKVVGNHGINKNRNNSRDANNNKESNSRKDARNVGNTSRPKQLCREDSNSRESSCIRDFSEKTKEVRTHFQIDRKQHKRKLEQQGTPTTIRTSEPVETPVAEGFFFGTVRTLATVQ